ncbi:MAG: hypothetical protein IPL28_25220, partial [Chloroflexi bacterium]|nr:hypothetical protein [Chloroflexota bacterium]
MERNKDEARHYTADIVGLRSSSVHPGMTMNVVANIYDADGGVTEAIDEDLVIVEMTQSMGNDGILSWRMVFGTIAEHVPTAALAEAGQIALNQQKMNTPQAGSSNFAVGGLAVGSSSGTGGGGGGGTAELDAHMAETFTAHQIPLQIDNKIATHAALTTTAHGIPSQIDTKIAAHSAIEDAHHD